MVVGKHREHDATGYGYLCRALHHRCAFSRERSGLRCGAIVDAQRITGLKQIGRDRLAHISQTYEAQCFAHRRLSTLMKVPL